MDVCFQIESLNHKNFTYEKQNISKKTLCVINIGQCDFLQHLFQDTHFES